MSRFVSIVGALVLAACGATPAAGDSGGARASGGNRRGHRRAGSDAPLTCDPGGLESAHSVVLGPMPAGCALDQTSGTMTAPAVVHTADELAAILHCANDRPSIDLAANDLLLASFSMSPAHAGLDVVDDGTTVTFVTRFRPPCPDDPRPMPMQSMVTFLLPKGATRVYREATCSLPEQCD